MKYFILLILFGIYLEVQAQKTPFKVYSNWNKAIDDASGSGKKVLIYFGAPWCVPCLQLQKEVFSDTAVIRLMDDNAVCYSFDMDDNAAIPFMRKFRVTSFPLIVILNKDGHLNRRLDEIPVTSLQFTSFLLNELKNNDVYPGISNAFDLEYPSFYSAYFQGKTRIQPDSAEVDNYLKSQKNLLSEVNWDVLSLFNKNDEYYYYLVDHKTEFKKLYGSEVSFKVLEMYRRIAQRYIDTKDSVRYNYVSRLLTNPVDDAGKRAYLMRQIKFLGNSGTDWQKFIEKSKEYIQTYGSSSNHFICQYALETRPDAVTIQFLTDIMTSVLKAMPYSDSYYMYGTLLLYSGKLDEANQYFEKTLSVASSVEQKAHFEKNIEDVKIRTR